MSILVVCPGCKKSFQVHDKFAGKSGPCPKCKATIRIPTKSDEVQVHTPDQFAGAGRGAEGKLVLKPIAREEVKVRPVTLAAFVGAGVVVLALAWAGGRAGLFESYLIRAGVLLVLSPVLAMAAYTFLRDDELEPFRGREFYLRGAICAAVYMILWGGFAYVTAYFPPEEFWQWIVIAPPFLAIGTAAGWLSFDIEPANGFFHYAFYLLVTVILGWVAGLGWVWDIPVAK